MITVGEDGQAERERKLANAIIGAVERFRERYEQVSPRAAAWWRLAAEWSFALRLWMDGMDSKASTEFPPPPTNEALQRATAALIARREASGAVALSHELNREELEEKRRRWRHVWARVEGVILAFETKYKEATTEDRAWAERVVKHMRRRAAKLHDDVVRYHPGMPRIDDIGAGEILGGLLSLKVDDDGALLVGEDGLLVEDDEDDEDDELEAEGDGEQPPS